MNNPDEAGGVSHPDVCHKAKQDALRFLSYRARTQAEVRRRLGKSYPLPVVETVLGELGAQGYLDDAAFAREWRRHREERRPRAQGVLRQELLRLGVEPEVIQQALAGFDATGNAYRVALVLARRLTGRGYPQFRKRIWSHLQRRGFDHSVISDVVSQLWRQLADPQHCVVDPDAKEHQRENSESEGVDEPICEESERHRASGNPGQAGPPFAVDCPADELADSVAHGDGYQGREERDSTENVGEEGP